MNRRVCCKGIWNAYSAIKGSMENRDNRAAYKVAAKRTSIQQTAGEVDNLDLVYKKIQSGCQIQICRVRNIIGRSIYESKKKILLIVIIPICACFSADDGKRRDHEGLTTIFGENTERSTLLFC